MKIFRRHSGFSLIEIVIVLAIIAILAATIAPALVSYVHQSKLTRANADVRGIASAIGMFYSNTGQWPVWQDGTKSKVGDPELILLTSGGSIPSATDSQWKLDTDTQANADTLANQLIRNKPNGSSSKAHPTTGSRAWRGPYLDKEDADPWGNRYMVNVQNLQAARIGGTKPTFVISAGLIWRLKPRLNRRGRTSPEAATISSSASSSAVQAGRTRGETRAPVPLTRNPMITEA